MRPSLAWSLMRRESRGLGGRLAFFMACLGIGVAAVVSVAGLSSGLEKGIRSEARQLLGADLAIRGSRPVPATIVSALDAVPGLRRAEIRDLTTVVSAGAPQDGVKPSQIVELRAVRGGYPFYGTLVLDPDRPLEDLLGADGAVVGPELLRRLRVGQGDELLIGGHRFVIRGTVSSEPDRLGGAFSLGPRVFVSVDGLARSGLEAFGSRIGYRIAVKLPGSASSSSVEAEAARLRPLLPPGGSHRIETFGDAQPQLREGLRRGERFLGLVALLSLLIGGIGVAQTVRAWLGTRMDSIAILRSLGVRPSEVVSLYAGQTVGLALAGSLAGCAGGIALLAVVPHLLTSVLPRAEISLWQPTAMARGLLLGTGVALVFALPPLLDLRRIPPLRVLRRDAEPLPPGILNRVTVAVLLVSGVFAAAWIQSRSPAEAAVFVGVLTATAGLLAAAAAGIIRAAARFPRRFTRVWVRHGLSAASRPGAGTVGAVVALGLGVLVVLHMAIVERRLGAELKADLPTGAPTAFLVGLQPAQWPDVRKILEDAGATRIESTPMVSARLVAVDGKAVPVVRPTGPGEEGRRNWALTREQNLTYLDTLPEGNTIVEGSLWSDPARAEVSADREFAGEIGARLGSTLTFDVQGVPIDLELTSLRSIEWRTFGINFFLVVEPGVLEKAPQSRVAAARLPAGREQEIQDRIAARFPNVVLLRIREIIDRVIGILDVVGLAVRLLGGFTVVAGIAILGGAISATSVRRSREVALLKTLGMTRAGVAAVFSVEYAAVGLVAGCIGATAAGFVSWAVLSMGMRITWATGPWPFAAAIAGSVVLSVVAGLAASATALRRRPVEVLRDE